MEEGDLRGRLRKTRADLQQQTTHLEHIRAPKSLEEQFGNWCRYFDGMLEEHCRAGVTYEAVREPDTGRLPCLLRHGCSERCTSASFPTEAEVAAKVEEANAAIVAYLTALEQDRCPLCGRAIASKKQEGRCVYAVPCGHRLFQGQVRKDSHE
jgi:hypothetical protein